MRYFHSDYKRKRIFESDYVSFDMTDSSPEAGPMRRTKPQQFPSDSDDSFARTSKAKPTRGRVNRKRVVSDTSSDEDAENDASQLNVESSMVSGKSHDSSAPNSTRRNQSGDSDGSESDATDNEAEASQSNVSAKSHDSSAPNSKGRNQSGDSDGSESESDTENEASRSNISEKSHNTSAPNRTARKPSGGSDSDSDDALQRGSESADDAHEASESDAELSFVVGDDRSNDNDDDAVRCFSPRTRQSMGIGRQDLDTESETDDDDDVIENSMNVSSRAAVANSTGLEVPESDDDDNDGDNDNDGEAVKSANTTVISPLPKRKSSVYVALTNEESVADFDDGEFARMRGDANQS